MPNFGSLTTFSGLVVCLATMALLYRQFTLAALMLIMDGTGGTAIFWDRWSERAGHQVHLSALTSGVPPTHSEIAMLATHLPLVAVGLIIFIAMTWQRSRLWGA